MFGVTLAGNRVLGNPSNGIAGTFRTVRVRGNSATDRSLTFGGNYLGELPALTDIDSSHWYSLYIECVTPSHFAVSAKRILG